MNRDDELLRYIANTYAEQLGRELQSERPGEVPNERGVERRVRARIFARRRNIALSAAGGIAASLALTLLLPRLLIHQNPPAEPVSVYKPIVLSAPLPDGFSQSAFEQDREKSVYTIADDLYRDDVVLTLEKAELRPDTLTEISGFEGAYGRQTDSYSLLTFRRDGVLYTLTCRHSMDTLVRLGRGLANL
ncbi:MAG: hypothetical protein LBR76_06925 [Oscillospiraceae bacterium]|jgi:hypothetical protein|nr:hypothetical protein [Oscillospiraceae bacterium]